MNLPPVKSEMADVKFDEGFLRTLAKRINAKYFYAEDLDEDVKQVFKAHTRQKTSRQMTSVWPNWLLLIILCAFLSFSWFLRRAIGLV